jgi:hypothetical protein
MRCQKSKRACPGYRDPFEANIRDETQATIRRFKRLRDIQHDFEDPNQPFSAQSTGVDLGSQRYNHIYSETMARLSFPSPPDEDDENDGEAPSIAMLDSIDDLASCFFLSEFTLIPKKMPGRGYYRFIPKFLGRRNPSPWLSSAYKAASLAALATRPRMNARSVLLLAQTHYLRAVREVNKAIQDPEVARHDETLASVLLLAFYEVRENGLPNLCASD